MIPKPHQLKLANEGYAILKENAIVYLASEERTGKTLASILIAEMCDGVRSVLVITKKKALTGWNETLLAYKHEVAFRVTNYHKAKNITNPENYDLIILDEAHNYISSVPKPSAIWGAVKNLTSGKPIIYMSATPHAQGYQMLYHQLALSSWSPWRNYQNFYRWHRVYGKEHKILVHGRYVEQYDKTNEELIKADVDKLFITYTRKELGFKHEPKDVLHYIKLDKTTKEQYNYMLKEQCIQLNDDNLLLDTPMKLRTSLHMLEGGVAKNTLIEKPSNLHRVVHIAKEKIDVSDSSSNSNPFGIQGSYYYHVYYCLDNLEKIQYILDTWGDKDNVAIMYNYIAERFKLLKYFSNAQIFQATSDAEGVDLSHIEHLVIYSQNFSTAQHTQRRARQANMNRELPIDVHFLLVKGAASEQVYKTVSINKVNFVDSVFAREEI